eukprot:403356609
MWGHKKIKILRATQGSNNWHNLTMAKASVDKVIGCAEDRVGSCQEEVSINLRDYYNINYIGSMYVGNPPQQIRAIFDTGSTNIWVISRGCKSSRDLSSENQVFDYKNSSSYSPTHIGCMVQFGSGKVQGHFAIDDFRLGGTGEEIEQKNGKAVHDVIHIKKQTFGVATIEQVFDETFDAIVGLAFPSMSNSIDVGKPMFDNLMDQQLLNSNIFAFYMALNEKESSELIFGWIDHSRYEEPMIWHPVVHNFFWQLNLDDVLFNGESIGYCGHNGVKCQITPDSGTSTIAVPSKAFEILSEYLPVKYRCATAKGLGTITFVVNGEKYDVPSHHFMERTPDDSTLFTYKCITTISALDIQQPDCDNMFIVGDAFMSLFYTVFDRDNNRVGMAKAIHGKEDNSGDFE